MPSNFPTATTEASSSSRDHAPPNTAVTSGQSHTPGPWDREMGAGRGAWIGNKGNWTALACGNTDAEAEANARLIAAAPDLLEALKVAQSVLAMLTEPKSIRSTSVLDAWTQAVAAEAKARAAIAKAGAV